MTDKDTQAEQSPKNAGVGPAKADLLNYVDMMIEFHMEQLPKHKKIQNIAFDRGALLALGEVRRKIERSLA